MNNDGFATAVLIVAVAWIGFMAVALSVGLFVLGRATGVW